MDDMLGSFNANDYQMQYGGSWYPWREWWDTYQPPVYVTSTYTLHDDKPGTAFKVLKALMASKSVEIKTARQFVDLMEEIIKAL